LTEPPFALHLEVAGGNIVKKILIPLLLLFPSIAGAQTPLEKGVLDEMNLARTEPQKYAAFLKEYRKRYHGKEIAVAPGTRLLTREGVGAVDEAIRFLRARKPLHPLHYSTGLSAAAADLVREEGPKGTTGHADPSAGGMAQRIERHGRWEGSIGENLGYGSSDARTVVMQLVIDDGVPERGHRKNIFNGSFRKAGISCGPHTALRTMCAIDFAGGFSP
jgi:uncharacterized protein YkwD